MSEEDEAKPHLHFDTSLMQLHAHLISRAPLPILASAHVRRRGSEGLHPAACQSCQEPGPDDARCMPHRPVLGLSLGISG